MIDLSVRGLVKGFEQGNDILKGITFDVNAGERVGISPSTPTAGRRRTCCARRTGGSTIWKRA